MVWWCGSRLARVRSQKGSSFPLDGDVPKEFVFAGRVAKLGEIREERKGRETSNSRQQHTTKYAKGDSLQLAFSDEKLLIRRQFIPSHPRVVLGVQNRIFVAFLPVEASATTRLKCNAVARQYISISFSVYSQPLPGTDTPTHTRDLAGKSVQIWLSTYISPYPPPDSALKLLLGDERTIWVLRILAGPSCSLILIGPLFFVQLVQAPSNYGRQRTVVYITDP